MGEGERRSGAPVVCQTHPPAGPNVACDTSHTITLHYRWPAAYVCRVHHWIPNQTLSGAITVWTPNLLWSLALSHSPRIHVAAAATAPLCTTASMGSVLKMLLFLVHLHVPPRLKAWDNPTLFLQTSEPLSITGGVHGDKDCCWSQLFGGNQRLLRVQRFCWDWKLCMYTPSCSKYDVGHFTNRWHIFLLKFYSRAK